MTPSGKLSYLVRAIILHAAAFFSGDQNLPLGALRDSLLRMTTTRPSVTFEVLQAKSCHENYLQKKKRCNCRTADLHERYHGRFFIEETVPAQMGFQEGAVVPATLTVHSALGNAISGAKLL